MREVLRSDCEALREELSYTADIGRERKRVEEECREIEVLADKLIRENATVKMNQNAYNSRLDGYNQRYEALNVKLDKLRDKEAMLQHEAKLIEQFEIDLLTLEELPVDLSPELWNVLVEKVTICHNGRAEFLFKIGVTITEPIQRG